MWKQILTQRSNCYQTCIFCTGYFPLQIDTTSCSKTQQNSCKCTGQISLQLSKYLCHSTPLKDYLSTCFMRSTLFAKRLLFCYFATYSNLITKGKMPVMQSSEVFFSGSIRFQQGQSRNTGLTQSSTQRLGQKFKVTATTRTSTDKHCKKFYSQNN